MYRLLSVAIAVWLIGCSSPPQSAPAGRTAALRSGEAADALAPGAPAGKSEVAAAPSVLLSRHCGAATLDIVQAGNGRRRLRLDRDDTSTLLESPREMDAYVPVGLACATAHDRTRTLFVVEYGEREPGCQICEWRFLLDDRGEFLNHAAPPMLGVGADPSTQRPNNDEYETLARTLGLDEEPIAYVRH